MGFSFSYNLNTDARNGPPPSWAGWEAWVGVDVRVSPPKKPSPWGEGGPAQPGRMRGRPGTQRSRRKPAYRRQAVGNRLSTRKGFGGIAPSSVTFGDSFPPRGNRWTWQVNYPYPVCTKRLPQPAQPGGRAPSHGRYRAAGQDTKKAGYPEGYPKPEKVGPGRRKLLLPGVLSSISHMRNGGRRQAPPPGRCAPRWVRAPTTCRVPTTGGPAPGPTRQAPPAAGNAKNGRTTSVLPFRLCFCGWVGSHPEDAPLLAGLGGGQRPGGVAQDAVAHAAAGLRDPPLAEEGLALRPVKDLPGPVDPAGAQAQGVGGVHQVAHGQAAVLHPGGAGCGRPAPRSPWGRRRRGRCPPP